MILYVEYRERCVNSHRSDEPYGDWREDWDFNVVKVSTTHPDSYYYTYEKFDLGDDVDIKIGDVVYVLSMTYNTGDSFGRASGRGEVIWVFKNQEVAEQAYKIWRDKAENSDDYMIEIFTDSGQSLKLSNPASGYFEDCGYVDLKSFNVEY